MGLEGLANGVAAVGQVASAAAATLPSTSSSTDLGSGGGDVSMMRADEDDNIPMNDLDIV